MISPCDFSFVGCVIRERKQKKKRKPKSEGGRKMKYVPEMVTSRLARFYPSDYCHEKARLKDSYGS